VIRDWDNHFMAKAYLNASMSTCRTRSVGALVTIGRRQLVDGFNGNLPGTVHCVDGGCERCLNRAFSGEGLNRCVCVHAEQNIVAWSSRYGIRLAGGTLYSTTHPCSDCFKLIVTAGIVEIVYDEPYHESDFMFGLLPDLNVRRYALER
jgi:dCMP deaminase